MKTLRRFVSLLLLSLIIAFTLCEVGLRVATASIPPAAASQSRLPSQAIMDSLTATLKNYGTLDDNGTPALKDVSLPGFTIRHYNRVTTDQPVHFLHTLYVFGSSTVWGAYVDDEHTIPSYLQRAFNAHSFSWRVVNAGQPSIPIAMEYYWLTQADLKSGDLVIFLDGAVDLNAALDDAQRDWRASMPSCQLSQHLPLVTLSLLCNEQTTGRSPYIYSEMTHYRQTLDKAVGYAGGKGVRLIHVMQPAMDHDVDLYTLLSQDDQQTFIDPDDWYDPYHYTAHGNGMIAQEIAAYLSTF